MRSVRLLRYIQSSTPGWQQTAALSQVTSAANPLKPNTVHAGRSPVPAGPGGAALCRRCSVQLAQNRWFSSPDRGNDQPPDIRGFAFHIPNPLALLKNKIYVFAVHNKVDPSFTLEEFMIGAKQAMCLLSELISTSNYDGMTELVEPKAKENVKKFISSWTPEQQEVLEIQEENINIATPRIKEFFSHGKTHVLLIDVLFIAFKTHRDKAYMLEFTLRFCRTFAVDIASDWTISTVESIKVRQFQPPKKQ